MRDSDVPQDPGAVYEGQLRRVTWAVGEDGAYRGVPSTGWEAEIGATAVSIDRNNERIHEAWEAVRAGRQSPLAYHMAVALLDVGTLATEVRSWGWRVRRHLDPRVWAGLSASWRQAYADVMGLDVHRLDELPDTPELFAGGLAEPPGSEGR
ncbi:MAG: hypothetical protein R3F61_13055 [Myxococcota bacterium]